MRRIEIANVSKFDIALCLWYVAKLRTIQFD